MNFITLAAKHNIVLLLLLLFIMLLLLQKSKFKLRNLNRHLKRRQHTNQQYKEYQTQIKLEKQITDAQWVQNRMDHRQQ